MRSLVLVNLSCWLGLAVPCIPSSSAAVPETSGVLKDVPQLAAKLPHG